MRLYITDRQRSTCVWTWICAFETDTRQLRCAVIVRFAFSVASLDDIVRIAYQVRRASAGTSSVSFATLRIGTARIRRARVRHSPVCRYKNIRDKIYDIYKGHSVYSNIYLRQSNSMNIRISTHLAEMPERSAR